MSKLLTFLTLGWILTLSGSAWAQRLLPPPPPGSFSSPSQVDIELDRDSLQLGDIGDDVESLQRALDRNGIYTGAFDGDYGPITAGAVREFQMQQGLPVTGIADSDTLEALGLNFSGPGIADRRYVAAVTESPRRLSSVRQQFNNAALDAVRQGQFINIGSYDSRAAAAERVQEARRSGFDARVLYRR